jgi:hypothetical protein
VTSKTLKGAYDLGRLGSFLVLVFLALVLSDVPMSKLDLYVTLALGVLGTCGGVLSVYGGRNLPFNNRAPTSAEMGAMPASTQYDKLGGERAEIITER